MVKFLKKLVFLPLGLVAFLVIASAAAMAVTLIVYGSEHIVTYIAYALAAYTLTVICFQIPRIIRFAKALKQENKYVRRYTTDTRLRVQISLFGSLAYNTAYAALQLGMGIWYSSVWYISLAAYYILLVIMRYFLLRDVHYLDAGKNPEKEYLRYRFCGMILVPMNAALAGIVLYITRFNYGFEHHYITTIALAAYTFTSFTIAIVNAVKYKKFKSPVFSASKAITLASACVSMLTLETAMLAVFGEEGQEEFRSIMTTATGTAVCAFVLCMAVYMIIRSTIELNKIRSSNTNE